MTIDIHIVINLLKWVLLCLKHSTNNSWIDSFWIIFLAKSWFCNFQFYNRKKIAENRLWEKEGRGIGERWRHNHIMGVWQKLRRGLKTSNFKWRHLSRHTHIMGVWQKLRRVWKPRILDDLICERSHIKIIIDILRRL